MASPIARANATFNAFMLILGCVFATIWLVLNVFLHFMIIRRVNKIAAKAEEISKGNMKVEEFEKSGKDELTSLGHSFNLMYRSLSSAVKLLDNTQTGTRRG